MKNIDVENMESYLTFYKFGLTCYKLALCCETIMCVTHVFEINYNEVFANGLFKINSWELV